MTIRIVLAATLLAALGLGGCLSSDGSRSSSGLREGDEIGSSGFRRSSSTYGTNERRMDTYGGATAPVLPTIGAPGYGK